jgi:hypothetical protein
MLLYTFPAHGASDNVTGLIVVSDQRADVSLTGVSNTDGIASDRIKPAGFVIFGCQNPRLQVVIA